MTSAMQHALTELVDLTHRLQGAATLIAAGQRRTLPTRQAAAFQEAADILSVLPCWPVDLSADETADFHAAEAALSKIETRLRAMLPADA